jgi:hypothetical protein
MSVEQPDVRFVKRKRRRGEFRLFCWRTFSAMRLFTDYVYEWTRNGRRYRLTVRKGFESDGASVPWLVRVLFGLERTGLHDPAWLLHDVLYHYAGMLPAGMVEVWDPAQGRWTPFEKTWTRAEADHLFARVLREAGVSEVDRRRFFFGVRVGGWYAWSKVRRWMKREEEKMRLKREVRS